MLISVEEAVQILCQCQVLLEVEGAFVLEGHLQLCIKQFPELNLLVLFKRFKTLLLPKRFFSHHIVIFPLHSVFGASAYKGKRGLKC